MAPTSSRPLFRPFHDRRFLLLPWMILGAVGWAGLLLLARELLSMTPPKAGFDLELLLQAGRRVADGASPYDLEMMGRGTVQAESLFYSYPPPIAQVMALVAWLPLNAALTLWAFGATIGLAIVAARLTLRLGPLRPVVDVLLPTLAIAPFVFPFAVALLFGNLDAWFPLAYGVILVGVVSHEQRGWIASGVVVGLIAVAKLHPASIGLWFLTRGWRQRREGTAGPPLGWIAALAALATAAVVVGVSLTIGGLRPWTDYVDVVGAGTGAELVDPRNIGPAAQIAGALGGSEELARVLQVGVSFGALAVSIWAATARRDPVESLAWATVASLVTLPVTWFHYAVALLPFAIAAWARARRTPAGSATGLVVVAAAVVSALSIVLPVTLWMSVGLALVAVRRSAAAGLARAGGTTA